MPAVHVRTLSLCDDLERSESEGGRESDRKRGWPRREGERDKERCIREGNK